MATAERPVAGQDAAGRLKELDPAEMPPGARRRKFTVDDYDRMAEAGILSEDSRVELIDGDVIDMSPIGYRHASCVDRLSYLLHDGVGDRGIVRVQGPFRLDGSSEPVPDVTVMKPRADFYGTGHPGPNDILWLVEVMVTTADHDRGKKLSLYARAGIPEVWLVDVNRGLVEVHRRPAGGAYAEARAVPRGQGVSPEAMPDVVLAVDAILG